MAFSQETAMVVLWFRSVIMFLGVGIVRFKTVQILFEYL